MRSTRNQLALVIGISAASFAAACSTAPEGSFDDVGMPAIEADAPLTGRSADADLGQGVLPGEGDDGQPAQDPAGPEAGAAPVAPPTLPGADGQSNPGSSSTTRPTTVETTSTTAVATTAVADTSTTLAPTSTVPGQPASTSTTNDVRATVTDLAAGEDHSFLVLTELRASLGLSALSRSSEMDAYARNWSREMAESGDFQHSSGPYGENIAFTNNTSLTAAEAADLFHQLWIDSPGHYQNMTNGNYAEVGVGLYLTEEGWFGTHVFKF